MDKKMNQINLVLLVCAIICLVVYDNMRGLWLKGITSSWFVMLGMINCSYAYKKNLRQKKFVQLMVIGLFLGMCADVLLGISFVLGTLCFALGHVFYLMAFYSMEKFSSKDVLATVVISIVSIIAVTSLPWIQIEDPVLKGVLIVYAMIISSMAGKAFTNAWTKKCTSRWLIFIGSILFWFSDFILGIDMFGQSSRITWILCSYSYWPAQNLFAHALFHYVNEEAE